MPQLKRVAYLLQGNIPTGGSSAPPSGTAGEPVGLLLILTKAA